MDGQDLVTVVVPTYNRWPIVRDAIASALDQTDPNVEVVVVDDGSTDGTADEIERAFPRVTLIRQENRERGAARNAGARAARGRWLTFLDSDDVLEPWHVATVRRYLRDGVDAVHTEASLWDPVTDERWPYVAAPLGRDITIDDALWGNRILICCLVVDRAVFSRLGGFCEDRALAGSEDWLFNLALIARGRSVRLDAVTARVRDHPERSMGRPESMIASRHAATAMLLGQLADDLDLNDAQRRRVRAGAESFAAGLWYGAGEMGHARHALARVRHELGGLQGWRATGRLWLQSLLGGAVTQRARQVRRRVRGGGTGRSGR